MFTIDIALEIIDFVQEKNNLSDGTGTGVDRIAGASVLESQEGEKRGDSPPSPPPHDVTVIAYDCLRAHGRRPGVLADNCTGALVRTVEVIKSKPTIDWLAAHSLFF